MLQFGEGMAATAVPLVGTGPPPDGDTLKQWLLQHSNVSVISFGTLCLAGSSGNYYTLFCLLGLLVALS